MKISSILSVNFKGQNTPKEQPKMTQKDIFIADAKSKISNTGLLTGTAGFVLTALSLMKVNKIGSIGKSLISVAAGVLTSSIGMLVRSSIIFNSEEYKKLFFKDYGVWKIQK